MATKINGKEQVVVFAKELIAGTAKHLTSTTPVMLQGSSVTAAEITAKLQSLVDLRSDVDAAKATTRAKLAVERTDTPALRTFMSAYVAYVKAAYGSSLNQLADFGIYPKLRVPLTAEAKVAAAAKRAATRAARHTLGTQQKKDIKGAVTGVQVTPITAATSSVTKPVTHGP